MDTIAPILSAFFIKSQAVPRFLKQSIGSVYYSVIFDVKYPERRMKYVLFSLFFASYHFLFSQNVPFDYWPHTDRQHEIIEYSSYVLAYSEEHEQALWVAYELDQVKASTDLFNRTDNFREDPNVTTGSATLADYRGSGFDRGHLAPAGDFKFSKLAMSETFFMTNMSPQRPGFNRGVWNKLEALVRKWATQEEQLYIVTGGVLHDSLPTIGHNQVSVPQYFYKVVLDYTLPNIKAIAFLIENKSSDLPLYNFVVTIDSLESLTGVDFFPSLEDHLETQLESTIFISEWNWDTTLSKEPLVANTSPNNALQCLGIAKSTKKQCKTKTTNKEGYCNAHLYQLKELP